ncbi:MAG: tRNA lysidine(34) synthetase TilS, partial [Pseudomonadota bacterium]
MLAQGGLPQRFAEDMGRLLGPDFPKTLALAVSGGGDSVAMLHLAAPWARIMGVGLHVVTVDHGLRAQSAQEAELVAREAAQLGLPHATLRWHWDGTGNLQAAARAARLGLIDAWRGGIDHVLFAHTRDDVAETFLMRLARGSGVDGLAAMQAIKTFQSPRKVRPLPPSDVSGAPAPSVAGVASASFQVVRPLLETSRAELRHYLRVLHVDHVEDPSNDDPRFDRVKARKALPLLEELGVTPTRLADTAAQLRRGSDALAARAGDALESCLRRAPGDLVFDVTFHRDAFATYERETQLRLLAAALQFVSFAPMRPRLPALE